MGVNEDEENSLARFDEKTSLTGNKVKIFA